MRRLLPLAAVALLVGCGGSHAARPTLTASTLTAFVDAPPRLVVHGQQAHAPVVVRSTTQDLVGQPFRSRLTVRADKDGVARVPTSALLSSLAPPGSEPGYGDILPWEGQFVTIAAAGRSVRIRLLIRAATVAEQDLRPGTDGV
jgi:hypothetical protein